mmetsp:Transcript_29407/g.75837  ORF Transcript_29407/g.75837 Transcript_29407/m.75837 type:complete len:262 (-) Transcript_29407:158-943(-)|eukprot:CAMPEP_0115848054 /NCGR_PEP_ID=MMETSP0287-20121206/10712_1 /TAXON_ID=412157 /ORGANISM="Chrysochromulina rotalis, Strain UIO044" /LENGTH=261 /DNA_ID=CAMNT_0003301931 /DNA_START=33 /DNA_END=818 /DNA_ORIENTATION=-
MLESDDAPTTFTNVVMHLVFIFLLLTMMISLALTEWEPASSSAPVGSEGRSYLETYTGRRPGNITNNKGVVDETSTRNDAIGSYAYGGFQGGLGLGWASVPPPTGPEYLNTLYFALISIAGLVIIVDTVWRTRGLRSLEVKRIEEINTMSQSATQPWTDALPQTECVICIENFEEGAPCLKLPCGHHFHATCIVDYLHRGQEMQARTCPTCRQTCLLCDFDEPDTTDCAEDACMRAFDVMTRLPLVHVYGSERDIYGMRLV